MKITEEEYHVRWKNRTQFSVPASVAKDELDRIKEEHGGELTPAAVVEAATDEMNPLHNEFDWNDASAAYKHRCTTARKIIGSIEIVKANTVPARVYEATVVTYYDPDKKDICKRRAFLTPEEIMEDPEKRAALLLQAISDSMAFRRKYNRLSELAQVIESMEKFIDSVGESG